jgi:hypothetical protein
MLRLNTGIFNLFGSKFMFIKFSYPVALEFTLAPCYESTADISKTETSVEAVL